ncbi:HAMP domain-containing protein [Proteiniclasticum sp. SCR006]|uniref:histidine kinase n=1 Tax=Proteiniclasticum aestuarii TaxID=2817862 RepID=A0A939H9U0_9CLOT|nr:ATP-binding protein [Proteiniclasticum aestuarii]MBO1263423.1 HAMP domain-containing protein [Proteiniclasticum aestuarii]
MNYKISQKLILFVSSLLILFSLIMSVSFTLMFRKNTMDYQKAEIQDRAEVIAENLSEYLDTESDTDRHGMGMGGMTMNGMRGFMPYLNVIDDIAMSDVWIVNEHEELILRGHGTDLSYKELPESANEVIEEAMQGNIYFSEGFSDLLGARTLTVGAPVLSGNQDVIAVVLLHTAITGLESVIYSGLQIFILSAMVALFLSVLLAILLSRRFVKPLKKMTTTAGRLSEGDYSAKTQVFQNDEIGDLARTLDILSERLDLASRESERLDQSRRDFISSISHELRTPVTVLRGSLEALKDKVISEPAQVEAYHEQMFTEILALQRLVDDLLSLTKLQNPDFRMQMEPLNLTEVLNDAVRSMQTLGKKKDIDLIYDNPYETLLFHGDYGRIRQMITAVLDNAIKFSPSRDQVKIDAAVSEGILRVCVTDHGKGIDEEDLEHIFERFYRHKNSDSVTGTGLGLAIVKEIAQRHDIEIEVDSIPHSDTVFTFVFRLMEDKPQ